jgi:hypothetical protein
MNEANTETLKETGVVGERERDPWFNPNLGMRCIRAHVVIAAVVPAAEKYGRKRALRGKNVVAFDNMAITLLLNLMHHYLSGSPGQGIPVPRSKRDKTLGRKGNRYQTYSFPRSFPKMLDTLCALGFAEQTIGEYSGIPGKSKRTTVRAGPKLIELIKEHKVTLEDLYVGDAEEIIILKRPERSYGDEGKRIDYTDTPTTKRFRSELRDINSWLANADIRFNAAAYVSVSKLLELYESVVIQGRRSDSRGGRRVDE